MIVADASAAVSALLHDGPARERFGDQSLHAPHLIDFEVASALRNNVLGGHLRTTNAEQALARWSRTAIERYPASGLLPRVWELRANLTPYDAAYVALAEALDCPLLTADKRIATAPNLRCAVHVVPR